MKNILILLSLVLFASCASTNGKKNEQNSTEKVEQATTKAPAEVINDKEIQWMSFEEALAKQKEQPKKMFVDAYTQWCGPCKMLDKNTFHDANVVKYVNEHYYAVKFDAEGPNPINYKGKTYTNPQYVEGKRGRNGVHQLTMALGVNAYPTMLFIDENADIILPAKGYLKPQQLELYLKLVAKDDYKRIKSDVEWQTYQKDFVPEF